MEDCVEKVCELFNIDPYKSISEGTLIITCRENKADQIVETLNQKGIKSSVVGELVEQRFGLNIIEGNREKRLEHPHIDPFWQAFYKALSRYSEIEV